MSELVLMGFPEERIVPERPISEEASVEFYVCRPVPGYVFYIWDACIGGRGRFAYEIHKYAGFDFVEEFKELGVSHIGYINDILHIACIIHQFIAEHSVTPEVT